MKSILYIFSISFLLSCSSVYSQIQLEKGVSVNDQTIMDLAATSLPYAASFCGWNNPCPENTSSPLAFIQSDIDGEYYALKADGRVVFFNVNTKQFNPGWLLTRWPTELIDKEVASIYDMEGASEGDVWHLYAHERLLNTSSLGCLANTPLRYGALENNGKDSLVIYMGKNDQQLDWILFSPQSAAIEFSARLALQDSVEAPPGSKVQYLSDALGRIGGVGRRAYAKVYFDDFDGDEELDILVWRKRYESRLQEDPIKGFELKKEVVRHYKFIEGTYQKQDTEEATIKTWLTTKQLTWSKGYPSKSECPGQTDQLIPEMHDPLLNDPDVLQ